MPQPARDLVTLDGRADRLTDDQPDARRRAGIAGSEKVEDQVGLHRANPVLHRHGKLG